MTVLKFIDDVDTLGYLPLNFGEKSRATTANRILGDQRRKPKDTGVGKVRRDHNSNSETSIRAMRFGSVTIHHSDLQKATAEDLFIASLGEEERDAIVVTFGFGDESVSATSATDALYDCNVRVAMFARSLYSLCRNEDTEDDAIDLVYERLASFLAKRELDDCNDALASLDEAKLTPAVIASILTITAGAKSVLTERRGFYQRARNHLNGIRGSVATERLLVGLA